MLKKYFNRHLPITEWLPKYQLSYLLDDFISGLTSGILVIPMSMGFALLSGVEPKYGLYSSYIGCFVYILLGTCPQMAIGPVSLLSVITYQTCGDSFPSCAILTGFYSGAFILLLAILQLGWVVDLISEPVIVGFKAGAVLVILSSQIKNLLGIPGEKGSGIIENWKYVFRDFKEFNGDCLVGLSSVVVLLLIQKISKLIAPDNHIMKFLGHSANILVILVTSGLAFFVWGKDPPFVLTGDVQGGFPPIGPPEFALPQNATSTEHYTIFSSWTNILKTGPFVIALLAILQNVSVFKAFSKHNEEEPLTFNGVNANQEMIALGVANIVGSFFSSLPVTGSISRSAAMQTSGVKTPLSGIFTGIVGLVALKFLTEWFYYIPKASLAAVIATACLSMLNPGSVFDILRISKKEFLCFLVTFGMSIYAGIEYGILSGALLSLLLTVKGSTSTHSRLRSRFKSIREDSGQISVYLELEPIYLGAKIPDLEEFREVVTSAFALSQPIRNSSNFSGILINFQTGAGLNHIQCGYSQAKAMALIKKRLEQEFGVIVQFYRPSKKWKRSLEVVGVDLTCDRLSSSPSFEEDLALLNPNV